MENEVVFIVGCARTGSTLLRDVLNRSNHICITPETHFLRRLSRVGLWKQIQRFGDLTEDRNANRLVDYLFSPPKAAERNFWGWLNKQIDREAFRRRVLDSDRSERAIFTIMMQVYAAQKRGPHINDLILGEKTPTHLYYVPTLMEWFPNAKLIHTFRDPRGIFVSTLKRLKAGKWGFKARYPSLPNRMVAPLNTPLAVLHTTKTWFDAVRLHGVYQQRYAQQYRLLRFEDFIVNPEQHVAQLCDFLGVPFERRMIDGVIVIGSSYREQRRGPKGFDPQAVHRWQEHIDLLTRTWFSLLGSKYLKQFGYVP